jgi:hypothetical protein
VRQEKKKRRDMDAEQLAALFRRLAGPTTKRRPPESESALAREVYYALRRFYKEREVSFHPADDAVRVSFRSGVARFTAHDHHVVLRAIAGGLRIKFPPLPRPDWSTRRAAYAERRAAVDAALACLAPETVDCVLEFEYRLRMSRQSARQRRLTARCCAELRELARRSAWRPFIRCTGVLARRDFALAASWAAADQPADLTRVVRLVRELPLAR